MSSATSLVEYRIAMTEQHVTNSGLEDEPTPMIDMALYEVFTKSKVSSHVHQEYDRTDAAVFYRRTLSAAHCEDGQVIFWHAAGHWANSRDTAHCAEEDLVPKFIPNSSLGGIDRSSEPDAGLLQLLDAPLGDGVYGHVVRFPCTRWRRNFYSIVDHAHICSIEGDRQHLDRRGRSCCDVTLRRWRASSGTLVGTRRAGLFA